MNRSAPLRPLSRRRRPSSSILRSHYSRHHRAFVTARARTIVPLSSGLEITRKSLGRHAIAIVQSTSIDKDAGIIRLNTMLAHSSGEWVCSEWPVCPIGYTASPQRMGIPYTRGVTHYSPSLALPGRMILMLPISRCSVRSLQKRWRKRGARMLRARAGMAAIDRSRVMASEARLLTPYFLLRSRPQCALLSEVQTLSSDRRRRSYGQARRSGRRTV